MTNPCESPVAQEPECPMTASINPLEPKPQTSQPEIFGGTLGGPLRGSSAEQKEGPSSAARPKKSQTSSPRTPTISPEPSTPNFELKPWGLGLFRGSRGSQCVGRPASGKLCRTSGARTPRLATSGLGIEGLWACAGVAFATDLNASGGNPPLPAGCRADNVGVFGLASEAKAILTAKGLGFRV